ncbi:MAG: ParA family protein [Deltaproteobacteria bacterium]|nr:ParA family protein [Deltaproteobacteria bacterium]MBW2152887.1 ParA family protein [Deltaproteobacteria bacterium]
MMAHIIDISSQKGGTGKTTTAVNLAASLAIFEKKTLLVDCDPLGNATTCLGIDKKSLSLDLYGALVGDSRPEDVILNTELPHLSIIPSKFRLIHAEARLYRVPGKKKILRSLLASLQEFYDYIIIDSPASLNFFTVSALVAAHWVMIPFQFQIHSLEGLGQLLLVVRSIQKQYNPDVKIAGILLTMWEPGNANPPTATFKLLRRFDTRLFETVIPWDKVLRESLNNQKPVALYDINSRASKAYLELAKEIIEVLKLPEETVDNH